MLCRLWEAIGFQSHQMSGHAEPEALPSNCKCVISVMTQSDLVATRGDQFLHKVWFGFASVSVRVAVF